MLGLELTEKQNKIWTEAGERLAASIPIRHLALQYYIQYRENLQQHKLHSDSDERISNLMQIAYFISEKNQLTYNLRGERVTGVALSINEIIKKNNDFEDFIYHMKEMLKVITIEDKTVEQQIQAYLKRFKFTMTFHHKFVSTFKKIKSIRGDPAVMQSLLWLIFIICKQRLPTGHETDIIDSTCLVANTFIYFMHECIHFSNTTFTLEDPYYGGAINKETVEHVLLEYFRLKDMSKFYELEKFFYEQMKEIKAKVSAEFLFCEKNLQTIYRKVDNLYQKRLNENTIDQRHFLKERINTILNANRFTPFGGKRPAHQNKNHFAPNQILSHRVLNYEVVEKEVQNGLETQAIKQNRNKTGAALMKALLNNKTPTVKTPLIKATPMTNAMEMYNWVLEKSSYHKFIPSEFPECIDGDEKIMKLINGLWKDLCLYESQKNQLTSKVSTTYLVLSTEIVYFVKNQHGSFFQLVKNLGLDHFSVWAKIDSVLKYDNRMPSSIKVHLLSLETSMISKKLWESPSYSMVFGGDIGQNAENPDDERLFKRVIHQIVYQVYFLCKRLEVKENSMNAMFLLCQYAIGQYNDLLYQHSLYQVLLCSCYAVSKAQDINLSFYSILMSFCDLNNLSKEDYQQLTEEIYVDEETVTDIINFYNSIFIKKTRSFLLQIKERDLNMIDITNRRNIINSPVKELLSKNMITMSEKNKTPQQTPFTQALMAYNQSPLLKEKRIKNLASCIDGKRLLQKKDFSKEEALKQAGSMISKKWRNCKSPESKFVDTIKKGDK